MSLDLFIIKHSKILYKSYKSLLGNDLINNSFESDEELAYLLYHAPFVIVSHTNEKDPIFNYANLVAQQLWELSWEQFTQLPSRLSAEPINRDDRQLLLDRAQKYGYIDDYKGIRISSTGKRFEIIETILWNLKDESGNYCGQAATFSNWKFL